MTTPSDRAPLPAAYAAGRDFAVELNRTPIEAQNWRPMGANDDLPTEDYKTLAREYGDVTTEMVEQYRNGFNSEFDSSLTRARD